MAETTVTATGEYSIPLTAMRDMLADVTAWQAWVGAPNAAEAKSSIHLVAFNPETTKRPTSTFAHIYTDDDWEAEAIAGGASHIFSITRSLVLVIEAEVPKQFAGDGQEDDAFLDFLNHIGAVRSGLGTLAGQGGYIAIERFSFADAPWRSEVHRATSEGDRQGVAWRISWSL